MPDFPLVGGLPPQYVFQLFNAYMDMEQMKRNSISDALKLNAQQRAADMRNQLAADRFAMDQQYRAATMDLNQQKFLSQLENMQSQMDNRYLQQALNLSRFDLESEREARAQEKQPYEIDVLKSRAAAGEAGDSSKTFKGEQSIEKELYDEMGTPLKQPTPDDVTRYNTYLEGIGSQRRYKRITFPSYTKKNDWWFDKEVPERSLTVPTDTSGKVDQQTLMELMRRNGIDPEEYDMVGD